MKKEQISYTDAIAQIEAILQKFNNEQFDVDTLSAEVQRATELIALCKAKLHKAEQDVAEILKPEA